MDLSVELNVEGGGRCPVQAFLGALKCTGPRDFAAALVGWPARETTGWLSGLAARRIAVCWGAGGTCGAASPPPPACLALAGFVLRVLGGVLDQPLTTRQFERQAELVIA